MRIAMLLFDIAFCGLWAYSYASDGDPLHLALAVVFGLLALYWAVQR